MSMVGRVSLSGPHYLRLRGAELPITNSLLSLKSDNMECQGLDADIIYYVILVKEYHGLLWGIMVCHGVSLDVMGVYDIL